MDAVLALLRERGGTVSSAESLTGGLVAARLTDVAGSSAVFRGGVVAYATDLKAALLGVDETLLASLGAVAGPVAAAMARGVASRLGTTFGVATTGVAGPDGQDGQPVGTVFVAAAGEGREVVREHHFQGDRTEIRAASVEAALAALLELLMRRREVVLQE